MDLLHPGGGGLLRVGGATGRGYGRDGRGRRGGRGAGVLSLGGFLVLWLLVRTNNQSINQSVNLIEQYGVDIKGGLRGHSRTAGGETY